jgi:hypothetical protein
MQIETTNYFRDDLSIYAKWHYVQEFDKHSKPYIRENYHDSKFQICKNRDRYVNYINQKLSICGYEKN